MIRIVHPGSWIRLFSIPDPRSRGQKGTVRIKLKFVVNFVAVFGFVDPGWIKIRIRDQ
jgi:hypothetical protein